MSASVDRPAACDAAVVDVGSNSVRLVLYRISGRSIWSLYNEKVLAGLGRGLTAGGRLAPEGVAAALRALRRFRVLIEASRPGRTFAVATAAVREAADGDEFCRRVRRETGIGLSVISGEDEARLAALGVAAGQPGASGLVGDLGGSSLELVRLGPADPQGGLSLPLGPFALTSATRGTLAEEVRRRLAGVPADLGGDTLHAVGGAWRNIAMLHMQTCGYPLEILHQYEMSRRQALETARFVAQQSQASLERMAGMARRRAEALPRAAVVLEQLIEGFRIERVVISAFGLREGLLFEGMPAHVRGRDPLVEGCAALGQREPGTEWLGEAVEPWLAPAFAGLPALFDGRDRLLIAAASRLTDLGTRLHPDHRAELVFDLVLRAPFVGVSHAERAFLACVAFARHTAAPQVRQSSLVQNLLSRERRQRARALGAAMRLASDISGRSPAILAQTALSLRPGVVALEAPADQFPEVLGELAAKRGGQLAALLGRELRLRPFPAHRGAAAPLAAAG